MGGLIGCARPVSIVPPLAAPSVEHACEAFQRSLPERLSTTGARRDVRPGSTLTAAYGDPAVTVRCGVPRPVALAADSVLVTVDAVDWFPERLTAGWMMTTVGRVANVEITVPEAVGPAPSVGADLSAIIDETLPRTTGSTPPATG